VKSTAKTSKPKSAPAAISAPAVDPAASVPAQPTPAPAATAGTEAVTPTAKVPRWEAPPTQPTNPDTINPESAAATGLSRAALANRPHMRVDIDLWASPLLPAFEHQYAELVRVKQSIEEDYPDFRVHIWRFASPIEPQFYVALDGISAPPERARWRRHVENMVAAKLLPPVQEYDSDAERQLANLIDKEPSIEKWVKPTRGQFQIEYCSGKGYEPDFVVETKDRTLIVEVSARDKLDDPDVQAKAAAAVAWCTTANDSSTGKPWAYALVPDDHITSAVTLDGLIARFCR
jgi:hypothetical protein